MCDIALFCDVRHCFFCSLVIGFVLYIRLALSLFVFFEGVSSNISFCLGFGRLSFMGVFRQLSALHCCDFYVRGYDVRRVV